MQNKLKSNTVVTIIKMLAKKRVVMKKVKKVLKVRNGFVEKDSSRDSAYGLSGF